MLIFLYAANALILIAGLLGFRMQGSQKRFSLYLLQSLLMIPLLMGVYVYFSFRQASEAVPLLLLSELTFAFFWGATAYWLHHLVSEKEPGLIRVNLVGLMIRLGFFGSALYTFLYDTQTIIENQRLIFPSHGLFFFSAILLLVTVVAMAWRLEQFWRGLSQVQRWEYKYLVVGGYQICAVMAWVASYRLTYRQQGAEYFLLAAILLVFGWLLMGYAVARHRLLNRKVFVSRKIVYAAVAPLVFGLYLLGLGMMVVLMRYLGWPMPFVLRWVLITGGILALVAMAVSRDVRHRIKFFISTHFYINKYEYRDEWLAFSKLLKGALTETEVVKALDEVLTDSLYTTTLCIWIGDEEKGYANVYSKGVPDNEEAKRGRRLPSDSPLIRYLSQHDHYDAGERSGKSGPEVPSQAVESGLVLFSPLITGDQLVGVIGIGPEYTGGKYGPDDYDLLFALGCQAASAIQAGRMAEELSRVRQQQAWNTMSTFVLHDIKNAAGMLSLLRQNAPKYFDQPDFKEDMLETIDDALKRMGKVQEFLNALKGEVSPMLEETDLCALLDKGCRKIMKRLNGLKVDVQCGEPVHIKTDKGLLLGVIENLLINAQEAAGENARVTISCRRDNGQVIIVVADNGPGLPVDLLPDAIFEPFKTTKEEGSGIGLWHVKNSVTSLKGGITTGNMAGGGARFVIALPDQAE